MHERYEGADARAIVRERSLEAFRKQPVLRTNTNLGAGQENNAVRVNPHRMEVIENSGATRRDRTGDLLITKFRVWRDVVDSRFGAMAAISANSA